MDLNALLDGIDQRELTRIGLQLVVVVVVLFIAFRVANRLVESAVTRTLRQPPTDESGPQYSALEYRKRHATLAALGGSLARFFVLAIGALLVLGIFRVDLGPAIAGLGLIGLGVGLGLQGLVKDFVAGTLIILEDQFARGDMVTIADVRGTVQDFGLRRTVLRGEDGTVHVVSNGLIAVASNETRIWARLMIDVPVREATMLDRAIEVILAVGNELAVDEDWRRRVLDQPVIEGVKSMSAAGVVIRAEVTVVAVERDATAGEYRRRIVEALAREKIAMGDAGPLVLASPPGDEP